MANNFNFFRRSKYGATKLTVDGEVFDSKLEAARYQELKLLEQAGEISNLRRQVEFELIPTQKLPDEVGPRGGIRKGKVLENKCSYFADFVYDDKDGFSVVEDTKGFATPDYKIKRKLMLYIYGVQISEVKLRKGRF